MPAFTSETRFVCYKWQCATSKALEISLRLLSRHKRDGVWVTKAGRAAVGLVIKCQPTKGCSFLQEDLSQEVLRLQTLDCIARAPGPNLRCLDTSMVLTFWESLETEAWQHFLRQSFTDTPKQGRSSLTVVTWITKDNAMNLRKAFPSTKLAHLP